MQGIESSILATKSSCYSPSLTLNAEQWQQLVKSSMVLFSSREKSGSKRWYMHFCQILRQYNKWYISEKRLLVSEAVKVTSVWRSWQVQAACKVFPRSNSFKSLCKLVVSIQAVALWNLFSMNVQIHVVGSFHVGELLCYKIVLIMSDKAKIYGQRLCNQMVGALLPKFNLQIGKQRLLARSTLRLPRQDTLDAMQMALRSLKPKFDQDCW